MDLRRVAFAILRRASLLAPALIARGAAAQSATPAPAQKMMIAPQPSAPPVDANTQLLNDALDLIQREYYDAGVSREELVEAALRGVVDHLNKRAAAAGEPAVNALLSRGDVSRLHASLDGEAIGIGVLAKPAAHGIDVLQVFEGSPAGRAGVKPGDRIETIDDVPVGEDQAPETIFGLLRGDEGTPVTLAIARPVAGSDRPETLQLKITRGRYRVNSVRCEVLDGAVAYVQVTAFTKGTADEVRENCILDKFNAAGPLSGMVIDLRGNPGGSLDEAMELASTFVEPGSKLLEILDRSGAEQSVESSAEVLWPAPQSVIVLVDGGTASAAEALASALRGARRAVIFGERTAGRGLGESVFALPNGGALRLETARYATATGDPWIGRGLQPDTVVSPMALDPTIDPQLHAALSTLTGLHPAAANAMMQR